jgi:hypothetical protein
MSDTLTEPQLRLKAHVYASLREHIKDELEYDRTPDFPPETLDTEAFDALWDAIHSELTALMYAAHADEAEAIEERCAEGA